MHVSILSNKGILMKYLLWISLFILSLGTQAYSSPEFAQGEFDGLKWEARFNLPDCEHKGRKQGAWCKDSDKKAAATKSGVEEKLSSWINDPKIKSLYLAYFSFSNSTVRKDLCEAALSGKPVTLYLDSGYEGSSYLREHPSTKKDCGENFKIVFRGIPFGTPGGHLQHMKIFMALEDKDLETAMKNTSLNKTVRFTSSSANMSGYGTNIHLENWLFFQDKSQSYLAQQNFCVFKGMATKNTQNAFSKEYNDCLKKVSATPRSKITMFVVPNALTPISLREKRNPYIGGMKPMIENAKKYVKVAIHRLTAEAIYDRLFSEAASRVQVNVIYDDDTYRANVGSGGMDVGRYDVYGYRNLKRNGVDVSFIETNDNAKVQTGKGHIHHNKFIVVDGKELFQGAGNFTYSALNVSMRKSSAGDVVKTRKGNYEQFYRISDEELVAAYDRAWDELFERSTWAEDHPNYVQNDPPTHTLNF
jgi:hypothetical protein